MSWPAASTHFGAGRVAEDVVVRVERVQAAICREVRVEGEAEQPAIPVVVDVYLQVGVGRGAGIRERVEVFDGSALLGDEHAAIRGECHRGRVDQAREDNRVMESGCLDGCHISGRSLRRTRIVGQSEHLGAVGRSGRRVDCAEWPGRQEHRPEHDRRKKRGPPEARSVDGEACDVPCHVAKCSTDEPTSTSVSAGPPTSPDATTHRDHCHIEHVVEMGCRAYTLRPW